jgi:uncharacterized cupin superfamily protein
MLYVHATMTRTQPGVCEMSRGQPAPVGDPPHAQTSGNAVLRGSCMCQGVAFEIDGTVIDLLYCHRTMCRKAHGTAFRARGKVRTAAFRWIRGEELVRCYESSPGQHRSSCAVCGSSLITRFDDKPRVLGLAVGVPDDDPVSRPICHVHVDPKAPWREITDSLPRFEQAATGPVPIGGAAAPRPGSAPITGTPHVDGVLMPTTSSPVAKIATEVPVRSKPSNDPEPFASRMAGREKRQLGDVFGLVNFEVNLTQLAPGAVSAPRHAHSRLDEFIHILRGRPTLHTDKGRRVLAPGMCASVRSGTGDRHRLINETTENVEYLEVGDRSPGDEASYPNDDLKAVLVDGRWTFLREDRT